MHALVVDLAEALSPFLSPDIAPDLFRRRGFALCEVKTCYKHSCPRYLAALSVDASGCNIVVLKVPGYGDLRYLIRGLHLNRINGFRSALRAFSMISGGPPQRKFQKR